MKTITKRVLEDLRKRKMLVVKDEQSTFQGISKELGIDLAELARATYSMREGNIVRLINSFQQPI